MHLSNLRNSLIYYKVMSSYFNHTMYTDSQTSCSLVVLVVMCIAYRGVVRGEGVDMEGSRHPFTVKCQCHFQYDTTKSCSLLEVSLILNNKMINLIPTLLIYSHAFY